MLTERSARDLRKAVAHYLFIESKDVPDGEASLFRAAALALIKKPVDPELLTQAAKRRSIDDALYSDAADISPRIADLWEQAHSTASPS